MVNTLTKIGSTWNISKRSFNKLSGSRMHVWPILAGKYKAQLAQDAVDLAQAIELRNLSFRQGRGTVQDNDAFDNACLHVLITETASNQLVSCFRVLTLQSAKDLPKSYSSQFYDLSRLGSFQGPMMELGRFCVHPNHADADILRLAWGALARLVDLTGSTLLFGCSSFDGVQGGNHTAALAQLRAAHLAPEIWRPLRLAPKIYEFATVLADVAPDLLAALRGMPPLLRTYLAMGGWVSDHAVVDTDLNTLHVFTAVEIANIPSARARALRAIAG